MPTRRARIRIGVGGWSYAPWRGVFYPKGLPQARELEYASAHLTAIEINATYYRTQSRESFAKWREATPENFVFSVKAPRYSTHKKSLAEAGESIGWFLNSGIVELADKLGPINWQFADTKKFEAEDFARLLDLLPKKLGGRPLRHALEARHESFRCPEFVALAREREASIVIEGQSRFPLIADVTAPFVYARVMGASENEPLGLSEADLGAWAARARTWAAGGAPEDLPLLAPPAKKAPRDVFLFAISGFKQRDPAAAMALIERLRD